MKRQKESDDFFGPERRVIFRHPWQIQEWFTAADNLKNADPDADFWSKKFQGEHRPNNTWDTQALFSSGSAIIGILSARAMKGEAEAAERLALLARDLRPLLG